MYTYTVKYIKEGVEKKTTVIARSLTEAKYKICLEKGIGPKQITYCV